MSIKIPKLDKPPTRFEFTERPRRDRSPVPPAGVFCGPAWFCIKASVEPANEFRPERRYGAYCGAPDGIRCACGAQLDGHDFGDEDPRSP